MDWKVELPKAVREIPREELERYVRVFERRPEGLIRDCALCALGAMAGAHDNLLATGGISDLMWGRYVALRREATATRSGLIEEHISPYQVIEDVFEGYAKAGWTSLPDNPRLAIYEACVLEISRRNAARVPQAAATETVS